MPYLSGTQGLYLLNNSLNGETGDSLSQTGTVPFVTSPTPPEGTHWAGTLSDANHFSAPASIRTALQGSAFTIEGYFRVNSLAANQGLWEMYTDASNYYLLQVLTTGVFRLGRQNPALALSDTAGGTVAINTNYYWAVVGDAVSLRAYIMPAATPDAVADCTIAGSHLGLATINSMSFGRLAVAAGQNLNGYIDKVRISNVARTSFPTTDPTVGGGITMRRRRR